MVIEIIFLCISFIILELFIAPKTLTIITRFIILIEYMSNEKSEKLNNVMFGENTYFVSAIGHDLTTTFFNAKLRRSCSSGSLALIHTS